VSELPETVRGADRDDDPLCVVAVSPARVITRELPIHGELVIGRDEQADLQLDDPAVSRRHARILVGPVQRLEDLGSANGSLAWSHCSSYPSEVAPT